MCFGTDERLVLKTLCGQRLNSNPKGDEFVLLDITVREFIIKCVKQGRFGLGFATPFCT